MAAAAADARASAAAPKPSPRRAAATLPQHAPLFLLALLQLRLSLGLRSSISEQKPGKDNAPAKPTYAVLTPADQKAAKPPADRSSYPKVGVPVLPSPLEDPAFRIIAIVSDAHRWELWSWGALSGRADLHIGTWEFDPETGNTESQDSALSERAKVAVAHVEYPPVLSILPLSASLQRLKLASLVRKRRVAIEFFPQRSGGDHAYDDWRAAVLLHGRSPVILSGKSDRPMERDMLESREPGWIEFNDATGISVFPDSSAFVTWEHRTDTGPTTAIWDAAECRFVNATVSPPAFNIGLGGFIGYQSVQFVEGGKHLCVVYSTDHSDIIHWQVNYDTATWAADSALKLLVGDSKRIMGFEGAEVFRPIGGHSILFMNRDSGGWSILGVNYTNEFRVGWGGGLPMCTSRDGEQVFQISGIHIPNHPPQELQVRSTWTGEILHSVSFKKIVKHLKRPVNMESRNVRAEFSPDAKVVFVYTVDNNELQAVWNLEGNQSDGLPVWGSVRDRPRFFPMFSQNGEFLILANDPEAEAGAVLSVFIHHAATGRLVREVPIPTAPGRGRGKRRALLGLSFDAVEGAIVPADERGVLKAAVDAR